MKKKILLWSILIITFVIFLPVANAKPVLREDQPTITKVSCGNVTGIPEKIPELTSFAITVIQIAIPVILVIMGSLDLFKGLSAQDEKAIKQGQQMFIKRLIYAAVIFFVVVIAKFFISVIADSTTSSNIAECIDCFLSGAENCRR